MYGGEVKHEKGKEVQEDWDGGECYGEKRESEAELQGECERVNQKQISWNILFASYIVDICQKRTRKYIINWIT